MKRLIKYTRPYLGHIILAALAGVGCSLSGVWIIDILREIIDSTVSGSIWNIFPEIGLEAAIVVVIGMLSNYLVIDMTGRFGAGFLKDMRKDTIERIMQTSPDFMEKNNFGDIMERLSSDIEGIAGYMKTYFKDCLYLPIIVIVFAVYLFKLNGMVAIFCLIPLAVLVPVSTKLLRPVKLSQAEYVRKLGLTNNNIQEAYDAADIIKSYNLQSVIRDKYYSALKETLDISNTNDLRQYNIEPVTAMIAEVPVAIALLLSGWMVFEGNMTLGMMVAVVSAVQKLIEPLHETYQLVVRTQLAQISLNRVFYVFDLPEEENVGGQKVSQDNSDNIIELKNVSFTYSGRDNERKTLDNIDVAIKRGSKVALVGRSGGGKSTVLKLICRQYEADDGELHYKGVSYKALSPDTVRDGMALISQEPVLFPMSVADNIRIGLPQASEAQIIKAAQAAQCHTFIQNMPQGYNTVLEEKGSNLSGGQRQRIAIARAILKDADILLLDEPTSALDRETEENISRTLYEISAGKTVITVAHRLSTIVDYDEIIVVQEGRIVERGNHKELMARKNVYYAMYNEYTSGGEC